MTRDAYGNDLRADIVIGAEKVKEAKPERECSLRAAADLMEW
jgi:hypothetical protein